MTANAMAHKTDKLIGFRAFYDRDDDILDWWENIPSGERSHVLRTLIRAYLTGEVIVTPLGEDPAEFSTSVQLSRVQADTTWIRDAILEIPDYIEQVISKKVKVIAAAPAETYNPSNESASEDEAEKRVARMQRKSW